MMKILNESFKSYCIFNTYNVNTVNNNCQFKKS